MTAFEFMGAHPFLTFFLACIAGQCLHNGFQFFVALVHGHPPHEDE